MPRHLSSALQHSDTGKVLTITGYSVCLWQWVWPRISAIHTRPRQKLKIWSVHLRLNRVPGATHPSSQTVWLHQSTAVDISPLDSRLSLAFGLSVAEYTSPAVRWCLGTAERPQIWSVSFSILLHLVFHLLHFIFKEEQPRRASEPCGLIVCYKLEQETRGKAGYGAWKPWRLRREGIQHWDCIARSKREI